MKWSSGYINAKSLDHEIGHCHQHLVLFKDCITLAHSQIVWRSTIKYFKVLGKIAGVWNIRHNDLYLLKSISASHWRSQSTVFSHKTLFEIWNKITQHELQVNYRSLWPTFILRSICITLTHYPNAWRSSMKQSTRPWNIGHCNLLYMKQSTRPWNIGHCNLHLYWDQSLHHTDNPKASFIHKSTSRYEVKSHWTMTYF